MTSLITLFLGFLLGNYIGFTDAKNTYAMRYTIWLDACMKILKITKEEDTKKIIKEAIHIELRDGDNSHTLKLMDCIEKNS